MDLDFLAQIYQGLRQVAQFQVGGREHAEEVYRRQVQELDTAGEEENTGDKRVRGFRPGHVG